MASYGPPPHLRPPPFTAPSGSMPPVASLRPALPPASTPVVSAPPMLLRPTLPLETGPAVTVFVGNITERAPDAVIRHLLTTCGQLVNWKRVQGATGRLQAFGFCEYATPAAADRAIRILHETLVGDKKLVVKVDAKTKGVLDEYKKQRRKMITGNDQNDDDQDDQEVHDPAREQEDQMAYKRIQAVLTDHSKEMMEYEAKKRDNTSSSRRSHNSSNHYSSDGLSKDAFEDHEMEEERREIVSREIGKFREINKQREAAKEEEKRRKEEEEEERKRRKEIQRQEEEYQRSKRRRTEETSNGTDDSKKKDYNEDYSTSRSSRSHSRRKKSESPTGGTRSNATRRGTRSPSGALSPVATKKSSRSGSRRTSVERDSRSRSKSRRRRTRSRTRSPLPPRSRREDPIRERELDEEEKEERRAERRAKEKDENYQERLRKWESRESKMAREYEKEHVREAKRLADEEKEARKLREFLEDYDDERDDPKFYRGRELERRLAEREREMAKDNDDREREREELEAIKAQLARDGRQAVNTADDDWDVQIIQQPMDHSKSGMEEWTHESAEVDPIVAISKNGGPSVTNTNRNLVGDQDDEAQVDEGVSPPRADYSLPSPPRDDSELLQPSPVDEPQQPVLKQKTSMLMRSKRLEVANVFAQDDDDDQPKMNSLPSSARMGSKKRMDDGGLKSGGNEVQKKEHIKSLIEKIPTEKNALFDFHIDWDMVDNQLMEKRIRPWVNKKITEYIGEPEPTLSDFICSKVLAGSKPKAILDDVQMVLDEEAEVFVVKLWRLLIYEIENKKQKQNLQPSVS